MFLAEDEYCCMNGLLMINVDTKGQSHYIKVTRWAIFIWQNLRFDLVFGWTGVLKISFKGVFYVFMDQTNTKLEFLYIVASAVKS